MNILSDTLARQGLARRGGAIHTACTDGQNREARSNMLLGSMLAGMSFANAPVAAVHALAYPLGGHFPARAVERAGAAPRAAF